jgi:hypothetical protein
VFIYGGDAMHWIFGEKALALTNGVVWILNLLNDMANNAFLVCGAPNKTFQEGCLGQRKPTYGNVMVCEPKLHVCF